MATLTAAQQEALLISKLDPEQRKQYEILQNAKKEERVNASKKVNPKREALAQNMVDKLEAPLQAVLALQAQIFEDSGLDRMTIRTKQTNALVEPIVDLCTKIMDGAMGPRPQKGCKRKRSESEQGSESHGSGSHGSESHEEQILHVVALHGAPVPPVTKI